MPSSIGTGNVPPAVLAAAHSFPERGVRLLAASAREPGVETLVDRRVLTRPELVEEVLEPPAEA
ncbi:hypothetical protein [Actinomadura sp. BRA 177]|uniref:hypothetical protein n=1 Tax=Actinomadura sp. BRA 177 TaxID=2745202 RepID=UPI001595F1EF|nr:hypothetical protein [Actinomadura sp. BRA 177]NVI90406.1 hypothetical protein [Actinomadura sp. BRA 177]